MAETAEERRARLGTGWAFPLRLNVQGGLQLSSAEQDIEEAIWIILRTGVGERVNRPNFGARLADLAFAPLNSETLLRIRTEVESALRLWEPRILLDRVIADPDPVRGLVNILIQYRVRGDVDQRTLTYPFTLVPSASE
jgi:hypothetical protein